MSEVNILTEMGKVNKQILTDFIDYYQKQHTVPISAFVEFPFSMQVGVLLLYFYKEYDILIMSDGVGNTLSYYTTKGKAILKHEYKEGGFSANYKVGVIRACIVIKERLE